MHERPQAALFAALRELGYRVDSPNDKLPATIFGKADLPTEEDGRPRIPTKCCTVSVDESSQFASALLLCARTAGWLVTTIGGDSEERPYVRMTEEMVTFFCVCRGQFLVDVDASSASYIWAANHFFEVSFGEQRELPARKDWVLPIPISPDNDWQVDGKFPLCLPLPFELSRSTQLGDSIMTAIVMAPFADHVVRFTDLGRLRVQECERVVALRTELTKCGAKVIEEGDTLTVFPSALHGAEIETYDDHRMAMCFAVLGLKVPGIKLKHPACVKKTFPNFFQKLATPPPHGLGAEIRDAATGRRLAVEELFAD
jgi:3-phosphoshikimate 1-carboxyvinyltransferase